MKRRIVGYFAGTESVVLTSPICDGHDTMPISNGVDSHGMHVRQINEENKPDLLMGYFHKIYAPVGLETQAEDMFHICRTYRLPFLVIVPRELHGCAREKLETCPEEVQLVDPADLLQTARAILKR